MKNGHLRRFPHPSSLRRMQKIRLTPQGSGALHLAIFEKPRKVVIPAQRLCRNRIIYYRHRHTGAGRYPELTENTGFRVAIRLHGMTKK